ncbi:hypothetical protein [Paenibacillus illinoisensis]|uniref:hypothetical protein n=1 Tax=Paenibacillus illinoisensis TaxID=59845 RepID=UPI003017FB9D
MNQEYKLEVILLNYENYRTQNEVYEYEYATVNTNDEYTPLYEEYYFSAGWSKGFSDSHEVLLLKKGGEAVSLHYRRPRIWENNIELIKLQDSCEKAISMIVELKSHKKFTSKLLAIVAAIMGGSLVVFFITAVIQKFENEPKILFALIALSLICLAFGPAYIYKRVYGKVSNREDPLLQRAYYRFDLYCSEIRRLMNC